MSDSLTKDRKNLKINGNIKIYTQTKEQYENSRQDHLGKQKKCLKKLSKIKNAVPIYLYSVNQGHNLKNEVFSWKKDFNNTFAAKFFSTKDHFTTLILKPDGSYFLKNRHASPFDFSEKDLFKLIKKDNWERYFKEWTTRKKELNNSKSYVKMMIDYDGVSRSKTKDCF